MKDNQLIFAGQYCLKIWKYGFNSFTENTMEYGTMKTVQKIGRYIIFVLGNTVYIYRTNGGMIRIFKDTKKYEAIMYNDVVYVLLQDTDTRFTLYIATYNYAKISTHDDLTTYLAEHFNTMPKNIVMPETIYDHLWPTYIINRATYCDIAICCP